MHYYGRSESCQAAATCNETLNLQAQPCGGVVLGVYCRRVDVMIDPHMLLNECLTPVVLCVTPRPQILIASVSAIAQGACGCVVFGPGSRSASMRLGPGCVYIRQVCFVYEAFMRPVHNLLAAANCIRAFRDKIPLAWWRRLGLSEELVSANEEHGFAWLGSRRSPCLGISYCGW